MGRRLGYVQDRPGSDALVRVAERAPKETLIGGSVAQRQQVEAEVTKLRLRSIEPNLRFGTVDKATQCCAGRAVGGLLGDPDLATADGRSPESPSWE